MRPILLVEDSEDDVFLMKLAWKKAGVKHPLEVAEDGQLAIDALTRAFTDMVELKTPCLVLLDLKLPRVPGLEVLDWIRKQSQMPTLPVIVLTSSSADADVHNAYQSGANSYFAKPADSSELLKLVLLIDEYWLKRCLSPVACKSKTAGS